MVRSTNQINTATPPPPLYHYLLPPLTLLSLLRILAPITNPSGVALSPLLWIFSPSHEPTALLGSVVALSPRLFWVWPRVRGGFWVEDFRALWSIYETAKLHAFCGLLSPDNLRSN